MAILGALAPLTLVLACGSKYSGEEPIPTFEGGAPETGPTADGGSADGATIDAAVLPECAAQRVIEVVAGAGGFAWFALAWPVPDVIAAYAPAYAYDDPAKAVLVSGTKAGHPLYARMIDNRALWQGMSARPDPTAFVFGTNQTHTSSPQSFQAPSGGDMIALGALAQAPLGAPLAALAFTPASYAATSGAPKLTSVTLIDDAIAAIQAKRPLTPAEEADLRPSPAIVESWVGPEPTPRRLQLAQQLLFAANAFRLGLVSTILVPGTADDPHSAFASGDATIGADILARTLDGLYAELAKSFEKTCGHAGKQLSLADNVVLVANGDTFKNPFDKTGWPDGTPGNSNVVFVRSNGFLEPGWFGRIGSAGTRTNFDPTTGETDGNATIAQSTSAAQLGLLYAITRGNKALVDQVAGGTPYAGVIKTYKP